MSIKHSNGIEGLYRSRKGIVLGVCRGLAEWREIPVLYVRITAVIFLFITGFFPTILVYLIAALIMKPEPSSPILDPDEREFYDSFVHSKSRTVENLKNSFDDLEEKIKKMEKKVTDPEYAWEQKFKNSEEEKKK